MKRPVLITTIGFIIGIILGLYFKIGIAFMFVLIFFKQFKKNVAILLIASSVVSFIYISYNEEKYNKAYFGVDSLKGQAVVISDMQEKSYYSTCVIKFNGTNLILQTNAKLKYGDLIEFDGSFKLPSEQRNYGGFDYREYLKTKKIYGIVTSKKVKVLSNNQVSRINLVANATKNNIENQIKYVDNEDTGGLLIRYIAW